MASQSDVMTQAPLPLVQSSTIPGDGASLTSVNAINKTHLGTPTKTGMMTRGKADRRSVISAVSEFKQDSVDLDEQFANAHLAKQGTSLGRPTGAHRGEEAAKLDLSIPQQPRK